MPRRNNPHLRHYGVKTDMISVRVPATLHKTIKAEARKGRMPKSRKVVELLEKGLSGAAPAEAAESVFE